jgi:hypothetical protein
MTISAGYLALEIHATAPSTEIWFCDDEGHFVAKGKSKLKAGLIPGRYIVEFGLATTPYAIDLDYDNILNQADADAGPACVRPAVKGCSSGRGDRRDTTEKSYLVRFLKCQTETYMPSTTLLMLLSSHSR